MQVSIFSAGFPLFRSRGDKKNRGATMHVSREKHSQFSVMETELWNQKKLEKKAHGTIPWKKPIVWSQYATQPTKMSKWRKWLYMYKYYMIKLVIAENIIFSYLTLY